MKIYLDDLYSLFGIFFFLICWSIHCSHRFSMWKLIKDSRFKVSQSLKTFTSIDKSHVLQKCRETSSNKCNSEIRQNLYMYGAAKIIAPKPIKRCDYFSASCNGHNLANTVQSRFSDILFSDKSRFCDNFADNHFFSS